MPLVDDRERIDQLLPPLAPLGDRPIGDRSQFPLGQRQVRDPPRVEARDPRQRGIQGGGVQAHGQQAHAFGRTHDRAVPFHAEDPVDHGNRPGYRGVDVHHGLGDSCIVQHVFGPTVDLPGQRPVEVLHRRGEADPVVRLELGHGNEQVDLKQFAREAKLLDRAHPPGVGYTADPAVVEIDELDSFRLKCGPHSRLGQGQFRVANVSGCFSHEDLGPPAAEDLRRGQHHGRMRRQVRRLASGFDQIGLQ